MKKTWSVDICGMTISAKFIYVLDAKNFIHGLFGMGEMIWNEYGFAEDMIFALEFDSFKVEIYNTKE